MAPKDVASASSTDVEKDQDARRSNRLADHPNALHDWRLHVAMLGTITALFLSTLETTIVATSLSALGSEFNDSTRVSWVVTAYLLTYSGLILFFSKLSDIVGIRNMLLFSLSFFALFSGLCAASKSLTQLIVFRALQGVGGSGIFSVSFVATVQICPVKWLGIYSGISMSLFAVANILGPILGAIFSDHGAWQWIFLLNIPGACISAAFILTAFPSPPHPSKTITTTLARVDYIGATLSIAGAILLIYALQTGGTTHAWNSAPILCTLVFALLSLALFFLHSHRLTHTTTQTEPLFPLHLLRSPTLSLTLLSAFFLGTTFYPTLVLLPASLTHLHALPATPAATALLALLLPSSLVSTLVGISYARSTAHAPAVLVVGGACQVVALAVLAHFLPSPSPMLYGLEVLLGVGFGGVVPTYLVLGRVEAGEEQAAVVGAVNAVRTVGGAVAVAGVAVVRNVVLGDNGEGAVGVETWREVYGVSFWVTVGVAAAAWGAAAGVWAVRGRRGGREAGRVEVEGC